MSSAAVSTPWVHAAIVSALRNFNLSDLVDSFLFELFVSIVTATLILASIGAVSSASPRNKRRLGIIAAAGLVILVMLSDLPFGPSEGEFWQKHPLFTTVLTSVVLLGAGYLAVEQSIENRRRSILAGQLNSMSRLGWANLIAQHSPSSGNHAWLEGIETAAPDYGKLRFAIREWRSQQEAIEREIRTLEMWFVLFVQDDDGESFAVSKAVMEHRNALHDYLSTVILLTSDLTDWVTGSGCPTPHFTRNLIIRSDQKFSQAGHTHAALETSIEQALSQIT